MPLDGFLELKCNDAPAVEGECRDSTFAARKAMSINSFEFGTELPAVALSKEGAEDDERAKMILEQAAKNKDAPKKKPKGPTEFTFRITKDVDSATPQLFKAYCQHAETKPEAFFDTAVITLRKAGGKQPQIYLVLEFGNVLVSSFSITGSSDKLPEETVEFTFKEYIDFSYRPQAQSGLRSKANIKGWDVATDEPR